MRSSAKRFNKRFKQIGLLSISTALAVIVVAAATTGSQAQFRPNSMSMGPRGGVGMGGGSMMGGSGFRSSEPRFQRFQNSMSDDGLIRGSKGKGKAKGVVVNTSEGDGRPGRRPPGKRPPWHGPGIGPIVGTGVVTGVAIATPGSAGAGPLPPPSGGSTVAQRGGLNIPPQNEPRFVKDEVLMEFIGIISQNDSSAVVRRNRLTQLESIYLPLTNTTLLRLKITDGRSVRAVLNQVGRETRPYTVQANFIFGTGQMQGADAAESQPDAGARFTPQTFTPQASAAPQPTPAAAAAAALPQAGDPAQYALAKLRISEAHNLANGDKILVAVIDSGVDLGHPELKGAVAGSFDALGKAEKPHSHGTAIAGAIAAHARLMGAAPAARILAIRSFGASGAASEATTMAILKGLKYATDQKARVINMSFAGPSDPGLGRQLAAAKANGAVLIAAAGNFGPKSPPQYPAADPNVIAVSATDANDQMFKASNIGSHVAVAAPGVDILLPAPDNDYQVTSGTSFSAAYVSGIVALLLQRAPELTPDGVRKILEQTAKDLGPSGKDPEYGAGLVDAYQAILAVQSNAAAAGPGAPQPKVTAQ
jgi:subtilisin family serine protease